MTRMTWLKTLGGLGVTAGLGIAAFAWAGPAPAPAEAPVAMGNRTACIAVVHTARGRNCNSDTSLEVRIENRCGDTIKMSLCLQRDDGSWSCFSNSQAAHGASAVGHVCRVGNQGYRYVGCDVGERCRADD